MIVQGQNDSAFGATEARIASMLKKDIDSVRFGIEVDSLDGPRPFQDEQLREQIDVAHG